MRLDFTKPVQTVSGISVKIISTECRGAEGQVLVAGYVGDSTDLLTWTLGGRLCGAVPDDSQDLMQTLQVYINVYHNGATGAFPTAQASSLSTLPTLARLCAPYRVGQYDF